MRGLQRGAAIAGALAIASTIAACERRDESPFEWKGLRAGMSFSALDRRTERLASRWKSEHALFSVVAYSRTMRLYPTPPTPRWGRVSAFVDTADGRVLEVQVGAESSDTLFDREMEALAREWDTITSGARSQSGRPPGPFSVTWRSADTLWQGSIFYFGDYQGNKARPTAVGIKDNTWQTRVLQRLQARVMAHRDSVRRADSAARSRR